MNALEHKIPPPALALAFALVMAGAAYWGGLATPLPPLWRWGVAAVLAALAFALAISGLVAFGRAGTTHNPVHIDKASALVTGGVYRFTRNPMYLGLTTLLTALAFAYSAPLTLLGPILFVPLITRLQIVPEERMLREKFGSAYEGYCARVRRWL